MPLQKLFTLGRICVRLERSYGHIERIAAELGIEPTLQLNDIVYFNQAAETAIDERIRAEEIERIQNRPRQG